MIKKNITALILMFIISSYVYSEGGILKKSRTNEGRYRDIEIEYNDAGQILEEIHRDKEGNILNRYVFSEYDRENMKPIKAVIYDGKGEFKAVVDINYNREQELTLMIQKDENLDIISVSQFFKSSDGIIEEVTNDRADLYKLLKHYDEKTINLLGDNSKEDREKLLKDVSSEKNKGNSKEKDNNQKKKAEIKNDTAVKVENISSTSVDDSQNNKIENPKMYTDTLKTAEELREVGDAITITRIDLPIKDITIKDSIIAQLYTDSIKHYSDADIILIDAGKFKDGIKAGKIYKKDLEKISEDFEICKVSLTGEEIIKLINWNINTAKNSILYLNTAGVTWETKNNSVENIRVDGNTIDKFKNYSLAMPLNTTNSITIEGIDFKSKDKIIDKRKMFDFITKYLRMIKIIDSSYILEERDKIVN